MKKHVFLILLFLMAVATSLFADKITTLTEVMKPETIVMDKYFYVTEKTTVYIYDRSNTGWKRYN